MELSWQAPRHVHRRRGVAAHGPPDQPDGHQLRSCGSTSRSTGTRVAEPSATSGWSSPSRAFASASSSRGGRRRAALGGRPELRPRPPPPPRRAAGARATARAPGVRRRPDGDAARPLRAAVGRLPDRRLREGLRGARAHAPRDRRRDRAGARAALADRRRPSRTSGRAARAAPASARWPPGRARRRRSRARPRALPARSSTRASRRSLHPRHVASSPRTAGGRIATLAKLLARAAATPTPSCKGELGRRRARRVVGRRSRSTTVKRDARHAHGATVNDVLVAALAGAAARATCAAREQPSTRSTRSSRSTCGRWTSRSRATWATASASCCSALPVGIDGPGRAPARGHARDGGDQALARGRRSPTASSARSGRRPRGRGAPGQRLQRQGARRCSPTSRARAARLPRRHARARRARLGARARAASA